ncbi:S46 family peptidase [Apibacter raozihei]|uniref:S46 family peptidase n=1 Tax=Apibacter raozihei TaxID=2500547 RepID=UPI000FE408AD|nr:S46 family peptidase [Apibacter raozihei]
MKINTKLILITLILLVNQQGFNAQQGGGMWIPNQLNEKEMKQMGMKISAKQIFDPDKTSIKDAIAHFGGGCTSEIISPQGLLLTNHHCGYSQIQSHSTVNNNLLSNGFWANSLESELPNDGLNVTFIVDIKDVTTSVLNGIKLNLSETERSSIIDSNIAALAQSFKKEDYQGIKIIPFYNGNQYYLFLTETFEDVRLVGAPPSSIGKFGSDTDNWVWPRHTGDFSLFRIYADKNNKPAKFSKDNVPYKPKYFLPISIKEKKSGDFSFVYGFPGNTQEYLPSYALIQRIETINPARISLRDATLKILDKKMREDKEIKIKYSSKYASIANGWKKWIGEKQGLVQSQAVAKKLAYEKEFSSFLNAHQDEKNKYGDLLNSFNQIYSKNNTYVKGFVYFNEVFYYNSETFKMAILLSDLLKTLSSFSVSKEKTIGTISGILKNYDAELDKQVSAQLVSLYSQNIEPKFQPQNYIEFQSKEYTENYMSQLWDHSLVTGKKGNLIQFLKDSKQDEIVKVLKNDPVINFVSSYLDIYRNGIAPDYYFYQDKLDSLQRQYMEAQLRAFPNKKFFPDANSTLRVTYGKIDGYQPKDAVYYEPFSTLKGVVEKYVPGDYEFDVSDKLLDLYNKKEYGSYAQNGELPVNYIATNHTTGGNSGSPALDADGNLVGLNFDRVWEGTMSDLNYDPKICRNIMVDMRYVLFIMDKYANAQRLINELKIIK